MQDQHLHTTHFKVDAEDCFRRMIRRWYRRYDFFYDKVSTANQANPNRSPVDHLLTRRTQKDYRSGITNYEILIS